MYPKDYARQEAERAIIKDALIERVAELRFKQMVAQHGTAIATPRQPRAATVSAKVLERADLRVSDMEREAVATLLGNAMSEGRLTVAEYEERLARVYAARTYGELEPITVDLPKPPPRSTKSRLIGQFILTTLTMLMKAICGIARGTAAPFKSCRWDGSLVAIWLTLGLFANMVTSLVLYCAQQTTASGDYFAGSFIALIVGAVGMAVLLAMDW